MSEQKKPREYALTGFTLTIGDADNPQAEIRIATLLTPSTTINGDIVRVIEYQALLDLQQKYKELVGAVNSFLNGDTVERLNIKSLESKLAALEQEKV